MTMDWITDPTSGARLMQAMVPMRDGVSLNTFVFLPPEAERFPVILHRTPYGIAESTSDSINRRYRDFIRDGYVFVLQDIRDAMAKRGSS